MPIILTTLLAAHTLAAAAAQKEAVAELMPPTQVAPAQPALTDDVIKKAVRETVAETPQPAPPLAVNPQAGAFRANSVEARMSAAFEQAKVPDCLHSDALKLQPAHIGPVNVVGPYSLPWVIAAVVRGKCN
ncbi:hypothetical protein [Duganella levis]|uniref:DUF2155 domain-containing protein n=1 Tax=Duganella levis TaxID=2692169 RepID=A0ABW9VYV3_9BURK|nr:hypothetical protein [Duganella levis]MYN26838.1 hypothetical protein [Duganella levis]